MFNFVVESVKPINAKAILEFPLVFDLCTGNNGSRGGGQYFRGLRKNPVKYRSSIAETGAALGIYDN